MRSSALAVGAFCALGLVVDPTKITCPEAISTRCWFPPPKFSHSEKKNKKKKWEKHVLVSRGIHWKPSFFRHFLIIFFLPAQHVARLTWVPSAEASSNHHGKKRSLSWAPRVQVVKAQVFGEMEARRAQVTSPRHKTSFQQNTSCVPADPHIT